VFLIYLRNRDVPVRIEADAMEERGRADGPETRREYVFTKDGVEVARFARSDVVYIREEEVPPF